MKRRLAVVIISAIGIAVLVWQIIYPLWLIQRYGPELQNAIQRIEEVLGTLDGQTKPEVMAQIATGKQLEFLKQYRCVSCLRVQVITKSHVEILRVLAYSPTYAEVIARVEWEWHWVSTQTGLVDSPCHAQAFTNFYPLVREEGVWKMTRIEGWNGIDANRADDSPELRTKYCISN